jgi:hypothetical protein
MSLEKALQTNRLPREPVTFTKPLPAKSFVLGDCEGLGHYTGRYGAVDLSKLPEPYFSQKQP